MYITKVNIYEDVCTAILLLGLKISNHLHLTLHLPSSQEYLFDLKI